MKGKLAISAGLRNGKTVLENVFFSAPFKLADISALQDSSKKVMIMNASPGVLDGDAYTISVMLGTGAQLHLETQSYQRLFQMERGATQQMEVSLMPGSSFVYIPHPSVPHKGAHFTATNTIYLSEGCRLVWSEVLTPGRMLHAEQFGFTYYQSKTEIYLHKKLLLKDNLILRPGITDPMTMGSLEGHTHQASLLTPGCIAKGAARQAQEMLELQPQITWGITVLPAGGFVIRMLGYKAELLFGMLQQIAAICAVPNLIKAGYE